MHSTTEPSAPSVAAHVRPFTDLTRDDVPWAGGKGANLGELTHAGAPVPPGFVVGAPAFPRFCDATGPARLIDGTARRRGSRRRGRADGRAMVIAHEDRDAPKS